ESLGELDRALVREHGLIRTELEETLSSSDPKVRGRVLYARCSESQAKLEGREVPGHFLSGCFNDLANRLEIGSHPDYHKVLQAPEAGLTGQDLYEVGLVQNAALGAILVWQFGLVYQEKSGSRPPPLSLAFIVLPVCLHGDTVEDILSTRKSSGLALL